MLFETQRPCLKCAYGFTGLEAIPLSAEDVNTFLHNAQTIDADFARQLAFVLFTECSVQESCNVLWNDFDPENRIVKIGRRRIMVTGQIWEVFRSQGLRYQPFIFKYRYASTLKQRLRTVVKSLGIRPMVTLEELREGYR